MLGRPERTLCKLRQGRDRHQVFLGSLALGRGSDRDHPPVIVLLCLHLTRPASLAPVHFYLSLTRPLDHHILVFQVSLVLQYIRVHVLHSALFEAELLVLSDDCLVKA